MDSDPRSVTVVLEAKPDRVKTQNGPPECPVTGEELDAGLHAVDCRLRTFEEPIEAEEPDAADGPEGVVIAG